MIILRARLRISLDTILTCISIVIVSECTSAFTNSAQDSPANWAAFEIELEFEL